MLDYHLFLNLPEIAVARAGVIAAAAAFAADNGDEPALETAPLLHNDAVRCA